MVTELRYSSTNTYLIRGSDGYILFDTAWAGTFPLLCRALGEKHISVQDIKYVFISHFHPDHMGIAQNVAEQGAEIVVFDVQREYIHFADAVFDKDKKVDFMPIDDSKVKIVPIAESRGLLEKIGIAGEILHTPGHSDDSISLWLDEGELLVGDLNPLYEMEMHKGTQIYGSWQRLLAKKPLRVYYGHAKAADLSRDSGQYFTTRRKGVKKLKEIKDSKDAKGAEEIRDNEEDKDGKGARDNKEVYALVKRIMRYIDRGKSLEAIYEKTGADKTFIEDVTRMYLTHQNVGVQGILDRIEIKYERMRRLK